MSSEIKGRQQDTAAAETELDMAQLDEVAGGRVAPPAKPKPKTPTVIGDPCEGGQ